MLTSSPPTSAPGTDKTGMDFRRILPEIRCQSCLSPGSEPTPRGDLSTLSSSRASARLDRPRKRIFSIIRGGAQKAAKGPSLGILHEFTQYEKDFSGHSPGIRLR